MSRGLRISEQAFAAMGGVRARYDRERQRVADEAMRLANKNTALLAENARLRRRVERLERVPVAAKGPYR